MPSHCSCVLVALLLCAFLLADGRAQTAPNKQTAPISCEQFKGRVIQPNTSIDYKLRIIKPDATLDQAAVVNPCDKKPVVRLRPSLTHPLRPQLSPGKSPTSKTPFAADGQLKPLTELVPAAESLKKARQPN